jgi:hypothetical protein
LLRFECCCWLCCFPPTSKTLFRPKFQAIIAYVNYSQVLKGAAYMNIAAELAVHATEELAHAITLSNQIAHDRAIGGLL